MGPWTKSFLIERLAAIFAIILVCPGVSNALEIMLYPQNGQVAVGGQVRVQIYATGAENLVSMGVNVSFDPNILEVVDAAKNDDGNPQNVWCLTIVKADGTTLSYNTPPVERDNTSGMVKMIGGHIYENKQTGASTEGLSGTVLLGWIDFQGKAIGTSNLSVDLAEYHSFHPGKKFDNFVNLNGNVDEPTNLGDLGQIRVMSDTVYDGDGDGLPDAWEQQIIDFDPDDAINSVEDVNPEDDFDHDGWTNIVEYRRGTDPTDPTSHPPITLPWLPLLLDD